MERRRHSLSELVEKVRRRLGRADRAASPVEEALQTLQQLVQQAQQLQDLADQAAAAEVLAAAACLKARFWNRKRLNRARDQAHQRHVELQDKANARGLYLARIVLQAAREPDA